MICSASSGTQRLGNQLPVLCKPNLLCKIVKLFCVLGHSMPNEQIFRNPHELHPRILLKKNSVLPNYPDEQIQSDFWGNIGDGHMGTLKKIW